MSAPNVGDRAPDFQLDGTDGPFRLSDHRGERVVLLFYPGDGTPVCTKQFCSYAERPDEMRDLQATVIGISSQEVESHEAFQQKHSIPVPLLADPDRSVAKAYGASAPLVGTRRAVIIVDEQGVVRYRHVHRLGLDFQTVDEIRAALEGLAPQADANAEEAPH
jgi:thioredoxin-dependent peroxiredoxin